jgi:hypothetical protein
MIVRLFDVQNDVVVPTEHCYTLSTLKNIMDKYPDEYLKVYQYIFYMTCPSPDLNPFFTTPSLDKEEIILDEVNAEFSPEDDAIRMAIKFCTDLYSTPTARAYHGIANMLDKLADYMANTSIDDGRDGNITQLVNAAAKYEQIRTSFKGAYRDLKEEQQSHVRGGEGLSYDS